MLLIRRENPARRIYNLTEIQTFKFFFGYSELFCKRAVIIAGARNVNAKIAAALDYSAAECFARYGTSKHYLYVGFFQAASYPEKSAFFRFELKHLIHYTQIKLFSFIILRRNL